MKRRRRSQRGFTLIELMISLVVFSFAVIGLLAVGVSMTQGFREQRDAVAAETLVRLPIDYLSDVLRQVSPGVPGFNISDADTCSTSALIVTNNPGASDRLEVIFASGGITTTTKSAFTTGNTIDVVSTAGLAQNDYVVVANLVQGHFFKITGISGTTLTLQENCSSFALPSSGYPAGSLVTRAVHATFGIGTIDSTTSGLLMIPDASGTLAVAPGGHAEPLAENIEDMQIAVAVDADGLGVVEDGSTTDDWIYNNSGDAAVTLPPATGTLRAVRVTLIAKSARKDTGNATGYARPATEDRTAGVADQYRRRVLKTTVEFRNTQVSP